MWLEGVCVRDPMCFSILTQYVGGCICVIMSTYKFMVCVCVGIYVVSVVGVGQGVVGVWVYM